MSNAMKYNPKAPLVVCKENVIREHLGLPSADLKEVRTEGGASPIVINSDPVVKVNYKMKRDEYIILFLHHRFGLLPE